MSSKKAPQESSITNLFNALVKRVNQSDDEVRDDTSLLDSSLSFAKDFFERQALGGLALISFSDSLDDFIAIKGEAVELTFSAGRAQALAGVRVLFYIDGKQVADSPIGPELKARARFLPERAGYFSLSYALVSSSGKEIPDALSTEGAVLHVLGKKPLVCVDAELLLHRHRKIDRQLEKLVTQGFEIVYVDFGDKDRIDEIRENRQQRSLPMGAIIPLTTRIRQFESFDVDFRQSFFGLTVSRLRAQGVPVAGLLSNLKVDRHYAFPEIKVFKENASLNKSQLASMKAFTKAFLARRKRYLKTNRNTIEWRVNEMVSGTWSDNNQCKVQLDNRLARQEIFKAIDSAQKCVDLQFYIFKESRFAHELGVRLSKAVARGVQVRLMVDALWSGENFLGSSNSLLKAMAQIKGFHILAADALGLRDEWGVSSLRQRDHRKLIVIDGDIAFVGGRNGADEYYYDWSELAIADWTDAEHIPWLDAHVQLEGAVVKDVQAIFDKTWKRNGGSAFAPVRSTKARSRVSGSRVSLVVHEGTKDANGLAAYESLICGADKKLILVNDFPVLDDIAEMLIQAVRRGVKVTFLTGNVLARRIDGSFFEGGRHRELFEYVVKSRLGVLADSGVDVVEFQTEALENIAVRGGRIRPYVHAKLITADGRYASLGSANLDITASYWEREANIFIDDAKVVRSLDRKLALMIKSGIPLDTASAEWKKEMPQREIVARLWPDSFLT